MIVLCGEQVGKTDFHSGADHTKAGNTTELGIFDLHRLAFAMPAHHSAGAGNDYLHTGIQIAAAADDILDLTVADVHLTNAQLVRIGMRQDLQDLTDNDLVKALSQVFRTFHLYGGHSQVISQLGKIHILRKLDVILDPI